MTTPYWAVGLVLLGALLGAWGQFLFKLGSRYVEFVLTSWLMNTYIWGGIILYSLNALLSIIALKHGNLSVLYPVAATSYIWVTLISVLVLKEPISLPQMLGIFMIIVGISLIVR